METPNTVVKIKATNMELTSAIKDYVEKKIDMLGKFLIHYSKESGELLFEVEVGKTTEHHKRGDVFRAEINFTVGGTLFRTVSVQSDLYAAIDEAKDEMQRDLRKKKNKHIEMMRRGGAKLKELFRNFYQ